MNIQNKQGQLGINNEARDLHVPTRITGLLNETICRVSAGNYHTCGITVYIYI